MVRLERLRRIPLEGTLSLDLPTGDEEGRTLMELIPDEAAEDPVVRLQELGARAILDDCMATLTPIEVDILAQRFGLADGDEPVTLRELGDRHSLSRERIRQLQERALDKLRARMSELGVAFEPGEH